MANYRVIFALLFVVLLLFSIFTLLSSSSKNARISSAEELSGNVLDYLRAIDVRCRVLPNDFSGLNDCIEKLIVELDEVGDIGQDDFENYDDVQNESGYIILINEGRQDLESDGFVLYKNKQVQDEGCHIQGSIEPGYTCKLEFGSRCASGDVLEVLYNGQRAYLKTC